MKSPMLLWNCLLVELGKELGVDTSRDFVTAARRVEHEGDEFLSITLPTLRKAIERSLDRGCWDAHVCTAFALHKSLPRFLGGFLELVFSRDSGAILETPNIGAIRALRQLTGMFGSLLPVLESDDSSAGCTQARVNAAFVRYLETDIDVASQAELLTEIDLRRFRIALNSVFGPVLSRIDRDVTLGLLRPRHSGGATADRLKGNQKWTFPEWTDRLEEVFPFLDNTLPSHSLTSHRLRDESGGLSVRFRPADQELPVRVIAVPKTCEKPRIISIEPSYMQYMQQAIGRALMSELDQSPYRDCIQLRRREHNQEAARKGSLDGSLATLDLKDASDRISWRLIQETFKWWPSLLKAMDATRSRTADVSGAGVHTLAKFASMGSALTFPVQTMIFTVIAFMGIAEARGIKAAEAFRLYRDQVRVFGDDIIIPTDAVASVLTGLETYGFKLNTGKSFWTGRFRESCGGDYFAGEDVSYVKVRRHLPEDKNDVERIVSAVALRNQLYKYGYWRTASVLDRRLEELLRVYPAVSERSPLLGRMTYLNPEGLGSHAGLQIPVTTGLTVVEKIPTNGIDGVDALTRWFYETQELVDDPLEYLYAEMPEIDRFDRSGRPTRATLKRRTLPF